MPLSPHLKLGGRWTFVGGKGGVGKTTVAAALAVELSDRGEEVVVISTDPAHSLGDAFGESLADDLRAIAGLPRLSALEVDAARERDRFFQDHGSAVATLLERGTYLDAADVDAITEVAIPGMDELAAILRLADLAASASGRFIIDTAPTGHTLRLLELPTIGLAWLEALEAMEAKHAAVASAFSGRALRDEATDFLHRLRADLEHLDSSFRDPQATRFVLVTTAEPGVVAETSRYLDELRRRGIATGGIVLNRVSGNEISDQFEIALRVPRMPFVSAGVESLRAFAAAATVDQVVSRPDVGEKSPLESGIHYGGGITPPADRRLYFVGGKGGVGKSTAAAALALRLSDETGRKILLLSLDPAGSLSEVLGATIGSEPVTLPGSTVAACQLDARAEWESFLTAYREEVEAIFSDLGLAGGATLDRQVLERLLALAPPGVDELMGLMEVIDALEDGEYDALVLDTAPTGHFLRLLEMPDVALEWSHTLLKLLLKYREVVRLEGVGERILLLSRSLRKVQALLRDQRSTWGMVVALPETLSIPETRSLVSRMREISLPPELLLLNRTLTGRGELVGGAAERATDLLAIDPALPAAAAPALPQGPVGVDALRAFARSWRAVGLKSPPEA